MTEKTAVKLELDVEKYNSWLEKRNKAAASDSKKYFVTISREYGCDGYSVAHKLNELLEEKRKGSWFTFTHPIMEKMVGDKKLSAQLIHSESEKRYSFVNWFVDGLVPDYLQSKQSQAFERMKTVILSLAERGNCIIIGGGASIISRELDPARFVGLHIRLVGSYTVRVQNIMRKYNLDRGQAESIVDSKQYARAKFVEDFTGRKAADPTLYHITFNNDLNNAEMIAKTALFYMNMHGACSCRQ